MIQRIQSIYLLLAAACAFGMTKFALVKVNGIKFIKIWKNPELYIPALIAAALCLVAIFLFKKRSMQILVTRLAILAQITFFGILSWQYYFSSMDEETSKFIEKITGVAIKMVKIRPGLGSILSIAAIVLCWMAIRGMKKDERAVRSMDRLR